MIFRLACGDVMPGYAATFESDDESRVMNEVAAHAARDHDITDITPDVHAAIRSHLQRIPA